MGLIYQLGTGVFRNSSPVNGGNAYTYAPGTLTPRTVYRDRALTRPWTHPIGLDAQGRAFCFSDAPVRLIVEDSVGVQVYDVEVANQEDITTDMVILESALQSYFSGVTAGAALLAIADSLGGVDGKVKVAGVSGDGVKVKDWAGQLYNVKLWGAKGDGSTTDTTAFTGALAAMGTSGGCLYVPPGTYIVGGVITIAAFSNLSIVGCGRRSIIRASAGTFTLFDFTGACANVSMADLQLQGAGTTATTASVGVSFGTSCTDVSVFGCLFTANATSVGWNTALSCGATRGKISQCSFYSVKASANAINIRLDGSADIDISHCDIRCNDGAAQSVYGIGLTTTVGSGRYRISHCRIDQATTAGIYLLAAHESSIIDCQVYGSGSSYGIHCAAGDDVRIASCYVNGGRYGIVLSTSVAQGSPERCVLSGNVVTGSGYHGIWLTSGAAGESVDFCRVIGNTVHSVGRIGLYAECCGYCSLMDNSVSDASTSGSGSYGSIVVSTANLGGHEGGLENVVGGNRVYYQTVNFSRAALEIEDYAGGGVNVQTTRVLGNDLFPIGPNAVWIRYAGANNTCWNSTSPGPTMAPQSVGGRAGLRLPTGIIAGNATLSLHDAGKTFLVTAAAAITLPTLTAAATDQDNFVEYRLFRTVNAGAITITCGGANVINRPGSIATTVVTLDVAYASCITLRGYNGQWTVLDATPDYANATYTSA